MERRLMLRLLARGVAAEAVLNGLPVLRLGAGGGLAAMPVHEYTLAGRNQLALVVGPRWLPPSPAMPPLEPRVAPPGALARLDLALVHAGQSPTDPNARVLATRSWQPKEGEAWEAPLELPGELELPVAFRRWRWLDAPEIPEEPATSMLLQAFALRQAADLASGDPSGFVEAARLRFEELGMAYQRPAQALADAFRAHVQALYAARALLMAPLAPAEVLLRRVAGGRLVEFLTPTGEALLRTLPGPDGAVHAFPMRAAVVENKVYVLR